MSNAEARHAKAKLTVRAETTLHAAPTQLRPKIVAIKEGGATPKQN